MLGPARRLYFSYNAYSFYLSPPRCSASFPFASFLCIYRQSCLAPFLSYFRMPSWGTPFISLSTVRNFISPAYPTDPLGRQTWGSFHEWLRRRLVSTRQFFYMFSALSPSFPYSSFLFLHFPTACFTFVVSYWHDAHNLPTLRTKYLRGGVYFYHESVSKPLLLAEVYTYIFLLVPLEPSTPLSRCRL